MSLGQLDERVVVLAERRFFMNANVLAGASEGGWRERDVSGDAVGDKENQTRHAGVNKRRQIKHYKRPTKKQSSSQGPAPCYYPRCMLWPLALVHVDHVCSRLFLNLSRSMLLSGTISATVGWSLEKKRMEKRPHVAVIGAGLAGLKCADVLIQNGARVSIFEARDRVGGRVCFFQHQWKRFFFFF